MEIKTQTNSIKGKMTPELLTKGNKLQEEIELLQIRIKSLEELAEKYRTSSDGLLVSIASSGPEYTPEPTKIPKHIADCLLDDLLKYYDTQLVIKEKELELL